MLKKKAAGIRPGDEYDSFGAKPKSSSKNKSQSEETFGSYEFDLGLSSSGTLQNAFSGDISSEDIAVSYALLHGLSDNERVSEEQFELWINGFFELNWDTVRIKRAYRALDTQRKKYLTFNDFRNGLKSTNSDVIVFYSNLMQRSDVHPLKGNKSEWQSLKSGQRISRFRSFVPKYVHKFTRKSQKSADDYREFMAMWREYGLAYLHTEYWSSCLAENKLPQVVNLWQKFCQRVGKLVMLHSKDETVYAQWLWYEFWVFMARCAQHQTLITFAKPRLVLIPFVMNFNMLDLEEASTRNGKLRWCSSAFVMVIQHASRPDTSFELAEHMADMLLVKVSGLNADEHEGADGGGGGGKKKRRKKGGDEDGDDDGDEDGKLPKTWSACCKIKFLLGLLVALDCTEHAVPLAKMKGAEVKSLVVKLANVCLGVFSKLENHALPQLLQYALELLSRIDLMESGTHDAILRQMSKAQLKTYNRHFGKQRIRRYVDSAAADLDGDELPNEPQRIPSSPAPAQMQSSQTQSAATPTSGGGGYQQKYKIGQLGASVAMNKIKTSASSASGGGGGGGGGGGKSRIIDVSSFAKLQNPFEFNLTEIDIIAAFRYADVNQDNAISFTDFAQSLLKVGIACDDEEAQQLWLVLCSSDVDYAGDDEDDGGGGNVSLEHFEAVLRAYPMPLHRWLCRIVSCNHLARQPFKHDGHAKALKSILKDQKKLTWKERLDALHAVARLFARSSDEKKEFQDKFKSFLPRLLDHLRDPHPLVVRAACVALTKIMIHKKGDMTKYISKVCAALQENFKKTDETMSESAFGAYANLVRHVPDNKKYATLQHIVELVKFKNVSVRVYGWQVAMVMFERIVGLKKNRPKTWWDIAEGILKAAQNERNERVRRYCVQILLILERDEKYQKYIEKYLRFLRSDADSMNHDVASRMQEYAAEVAEQENALDVYSLISTEQDFEEDALADDQKEDANGGAGGGGAFDAFNFVDDILDEGKQQQQERAEQQQAVDPLHNKGLGQRLVLHSICAATVSSVYALYEIGSQWRHTRTLLASLKYFGIHIPRGDLTLLVSEVMAGSGDSAQLLSVDEYAFVVRHCYATLDVAWNTYLAPKLDFLDDNMDDDRLAEIGNVDTSFAQNVRVFERMCVGGAEHSLVAKCNFLQFDLYNLFVTPELENDLDKFDEFFERLSPLLLQQLADHGLSNALWCQELCLFVSRIAQCHTAAFGEFAARFYAQLFELCAYGNRVIVHCCAKTCLVMASQISFTAPVTAEQVTRALMQATQLLQEDPRRLPLHLAIFTCLLASLRHNVPLAGKVGSLQLELLDKLWSVCRAAVYGVVREAAQAPLTQVCRAIVAYMHSAQCMNLFARESNELSESAWQLIEPLGEHKVWEQILREELEGNETAPFNELALEYGWDGLQLAKSGGAEFDARHQLLEQWYELEQASKNPIGMAGVAQLIKALNHAKFKAKQTQSTPDADDDAHTPAGDHDAPSKNTAKNIKLSGLAAQHLEQQRQQNLKSNK